MRRSLRTKVLALVLGIPALLALASLILNVSSAQSRPRKPTGKVPIEFRILATRRHDAQAVDEALKQDDLSQAPRGYRWVKVDARSGLKPDDETIIRQDPKSGTPFLLVRLDPQSVTEKDMASVFLTQDERQSPAIEFRFDPEGARRFGRLTREHLPEEGGVFKYRLAIILDGAVISAPFINSEIRDAGIIELGPGGFKPGEVERLINLMTQLYLFAPRPALSPNAAARQWFRDAKFGLFVHWGVYSLLGKGEWVMNNDKLPISEYEKLPPRFNPTEFDADAWVKTAKAAGMKYITITAKHHDGFCMFDSKLTRYDIVDATPYGKDPMKALADACHAQGIKLFFYYSLLDWHHPDYFPRGRTGQTAGREEKGDWKKYVAYYQGQVRELCTNYGAIGGIWFDGWWDRPDADWDLGGTYKLIHDLQPGALAGNNHHVKPFPGEDFQMFEQDLPGENKAGFNKAETDESLPLETCLTMNNSWGYNANDRHFKSPEQIIHTLLGAAGRGANLLLNVGPRPDGTIGPEFTERLLAVGKWLDRYGETVYGTRRGPVPPQPWGVSTTKLFKDGAPELAYLHVLKPGVPVRLPDKFRSFDARLFGAADLLPVAQERGGILINLSEKDRTPIDTIIVLSPKLLPR